MVEATATRVKIRGTVDSSADAVRTKGRSVARKRVTHDFIVARV